MAGTGGLTLVFVGLLCGFIMWFYYVVLLCGFQKTIKCLCGLEI
mgnify:FL=1